MASMELALTESLLTKMSSSIWVDDAICVEEKHLKKRWFVRNGQIIDKAENYERPLMVLVVKNIKKKNVAFGPIIQVGSTPFHVGKGKNRETKDALMFLALWKNNGFVSIIVDPAEYDMDITNKFQSDEVSREVLVASEKGEFENTWFQRYVADSEPALIPLVQAEYEARVGTPWREFPLKLKIRTLVDTSTSTTPETLTARGSENKEPFVRDKQIARRTPLQNPAIVEPPTSHSAEEVQAMPVNEAPALGSDEVTIEEIVASDPAPLPAPQELIEIVPVVPTVIP